MNHATPGSRTLLDYTDAEFEALAPAEQAALLFPFDDGVLPGPLVMALPPSQPPTDLLGELLVMSAASFDGRPFASRTEFQRDAEFARLVRGAQS